MTTSGVAWLALTGAVTVGSRRALRLRMRRQLDEGARQLVVDMGAVGNFDPAGLAVLLVFARALHACGGSLTVVNVPDHCISVMRRVHVEDELIGDRV
jgi:ABC-type transporter Mla MlaB component